MWIRPSPECLDIPKLRSGFDVPARHHEALASRVRYPYRNVPLMRRRLGSTSVVCGERIRNRKCPPTGGRMARRVAELGTAATVGCDPATISTIARGLPQLRRGSQAWHEPC